MTLPLILYRSLRQHALSTLVTAGSIALAVGLLMVVWMVKDQSQRAFVETSTGFDAVLGARGSRLQLVLNAIFHLEASPGTIAAADFVNGIVVHTVTGASALSTPTGAQIAAVLPAGVTTGDAFRFHVITVGAGGDDISTLTAGDGDVTFVGNVTVGPDASTFNGFGSWIFRMTGATTFVGYRVG
jgi:hypothetical protein